MVDTVAAQIAAYRAAKLDRNGESYEKCEIVEGLENYLDQPEVLAFYLDLIADPDEYDLARIEALKVLQLWEPPSDHVRTRIGCRLAEVLHVEPDILVQQWVAIAAENFIGIAEVFVAASSLLVDHKADLVVRCNCLAAIQSLGPTSQTRSVLETLSHDPELRASVGRILKEWDGRFDSAK